MEGVTSQAITTMSQYKPEQWLHFGSVMVSFQKNMVAIW